MSNRRTIQHRLQRDTANQEVSDLKKEVESLKRQLARLRKENENLRQNENEKDEDEEVVSPTPASTCPKCGSDNLGKIGTPSGRVVTACRSCRKWRSKPV